MNVIQQYKQSSLLTDGSNPREFIVRSAGVRRIPTHTIDNFGCMVYSRHFFHARSTFASTALKVSLLRKRFWTFGIKDSGIFGSYQNCVSTADYMEITNHWIASVRQNHMIQTGSCHFESIAALI
jgi:hypothetical protein